MADAEADSSIVGAEMLVEAAQAVMAGHAAARLDPDLARRKVEFVVEDDDVGGRDPIAYRILGIDATHVTRRWFYLVPARGEPLKLVHAVEAGRLDGLPGEKVVYLPWQEMHRALGDMLADQRVVAMQYSPDCTIPHLSRVDAGTVDLVPWALQSLGGVVRGAGKRPPRDGSDVQPRSPRRGARPDRHTTRRRG